MQEPKKKSVFHDATELKKQKSKTERLLMYPVKRSGKKCSDSWEGRKRFNKQTKDKIKTSHLSPVVELPLDSVI